MSEPGAATVPRWFSAQGRAASLVQDGTREAFYTQSLARIDEVLSVVNESGKHWYRTDALGSVYGLSSASGKLANQDYDVFGALVPDQAGPAGQPFGFTGREHELDSGLVYARARYLNPRTGRWTQPDPLGFVAGNNFFNYVSNSPAGAGDALGLMASPAPLGARTTLEAYAFLYPLAFIYLLRDLGMNTERQSLERQVQHQLGFENELAEMISNAVPYVLSNCTENKRRPWTRYFRAMSVDDLAEFSKWPHAIYSKMVRGGGDMASVIAAHIQSSTAIAHVESGNKVAGLSPYVSTSTSLSVAFDRYADMSYVPPNPGDRPTGRGVSFTSSRRTIPGKISDEEFLFLFGIGVSGEVLHEVDRRGNPILQ